MGIRSLWSLQALTRDSVSCPWRPLRLLQNKCLYLNHCNRAGTTWYLCYFAVGPSSVWLSVPCVPGPGKLTQPPFGCYTPPILDTVSTPEDMSCPCFGGPCARRRWQVVHRPSDAVLGVVLMPHVLWTGVVNPGIGGVLCTFGSLWAIDALPESMKIVTSSLVLLQ